MNLSRRLRALFRRDRLEAEMAEELQTHLELQALENEKRGMAPAEARRAAQRQFGGLEQIKERAREQRGGLWLDQLRADCTHAARSLRKSPGFTLAVVATLAVGLGLVTAVVNVARPLLWPRLPFRDAERLVVLRERSNRFKEGYAGLVTERFAEYARHTAAFTAIGAEKIEVANLVVDGEPFPVRVSAVTEGFFAALAVGCSKGRLFVAEEYQPGAAGDTVVLSHNAWARFLGSDPAIVGRDVNLGGRLRRVVGILEPRFTATPTSAEMDGIYISLAPLTGPTPGMAMVVNAIARLKPGITLMQATEELRTIHPQMSGPPSEYYAKLEPVLTSLPDVFRERRADPFRIFLGAAVGLYLIGGATVANLMLSRAVGRRRELSVRLALGGTPARVARLIVTEALLLALLGAVAGTVLAGWAQGAMMHLIPAGVDPELWPPAGWSWTTLGFSFAVGAFTCVVAALIPVRGAGRVGLAEALKEGAGSLGQSPRLSLLRSAFVVVQCALAVALLVGVGLLLRTVTRIQAIDPGFDPNHKVIVAGTRTGAVDRSRLEALNAAIAERIAALPGIAEAAQTTAVPLAGSASLAPFTVEGMTDQPVAAYGFAVSPDYFRAMGIPLVAGTDFADLRPGDRPVAIVDESVARDYFPQENPVGRFLAVGNQRLEIVGVARSVLVGHRGTTAVSASGKAVSAQIYTPIWQARASARGALNVVVRLGGEVLPDFAAAVRRAAFEVDPSVVVRVSLLDETIGSWSRTERRTLRMLQLLAGLALALAIFGSFSVAAYSVATRRGEFGLRLVLGATPRRLAGLVLKQGVTLGALGIGLGLSLAWGLSRFVQTMLYQTSAHDPLVYIGVAVLLLGATVLACWLPARRAAKVDPMVVLRCE